jgi:hypothetical protein
VVDQDIRDYPLTIVPPILIPVQVNGGSGTRVSLTRSGNEVFHTQVASRDAKGRLHFSGVGPGSYYVTVDAPPEFITNVAVFKWISEQADPLDRCDPLPGSKRVTSGLYRYLDGHGHYDREKPLLVPTVIPGGDSCISVSVSAGSQLIGRVIDRASRPMPGALVVALPRGVWGANDNQVAITPADRYLTTTTDAGNSVRASAGAEYCFAANVFRWTRRSRVALYVESAVRDSGHHRGGNPRTQYGKLKTGHVNTTLATSSCTLPKIFIKSSLP